MKVETAQVMKVETAQVMNRIQCHWTLCLFTFLLLGCGDRNRESRDLAADNQDANGSRLVAESEVVAQAISHRRHSPQQYLSGVLAKYRNATTYHDRAVIRLEYPTARGTGTKTAPLRVWYDRDQLFVQAYDVQLLSDSNGTMAWIDDQATNDFDSQVLRTGPIHGRPTIESLLADPILRDHMVSGIAGTPPQLEWLFSEETMKLLFRSEHRFAFDNAEIIDNRSCSVVRVQANQELYRFWIDQTSEVIRRIDFPVMAAPAISGQAPVAMTLTLDLVAASFSSPNRAPDVKPLPDNARYVSEFVPLPPVEPPKNLGLHPRPFEVRTSDRRIVVSEKGSGRTATLVVRYAGDERSNVAAATISYWHSQIPADLLSKIDVVVLADEAMADPLSRQISLPIVIDHNDDAARALDLAPGTLAIQDRSGQIAWMQSDLSTSGLVSLGAIIADVIQGIDVPSRVHQQWRQQADAYQDALSAVAVKP